MEQTPIIILLGGFLGAGKTTLILSAARALHARGVKAAAILNDQGGELVDTQLVQGSGIDADQVTGGCFCCRFSELVDATERLRVHAPAVIFAEAVGSCTDISATLLQPLMCEYSDRFRVAPYSVLVDPERARDLTVDGADADLAFLFNKQMDEADLLCFTNTDLHTNFPKLRGAPVRYLSPFTGDGVEAWLDELLVGHIATGSRILNIDYERYARAEASLAWLNCRVLVTLQHPLSPPYVIGPLLDDLDAAITEAGLQIVHLKLIDNCPSGYVKASILKNGADPRVEGMLNASPAATHELLLNVRATGNPDVLQSIVELKMSKIPGTLTMQTMQCFTPAAPKPERRYA